MFQTVVVNRRKEHFEVDIGRASKWGNPFSCNPHSKAKFIVDTRDESIAYHVCWILAQPWLLADLEELKGKILGCFCKPRTCHGDILKILANNFDPNEEFSDYSAFW